MPHLSRRSFLRYVSVSAGLLSVSRLRLAPAAAASAPAGPLQVLTPHEADILTAIVGRIVASGDASMPAVGSTGTIATIDQILLQLDATLQTQVRWLLRIVQYGPPVFLFKLHTFTGLTAADQDRFLTALATSRSQTLRLAFRALKNLSMIGYYSQDETWPAIHYGGPWAPRPRRTLTAES